MGEILNVHKHNIILVGMMGTGKSTVGKVLAKQAGLRLVDLDQAIVEETGITISEIFEQRGEAYFRDLESNLLKKLLAENGIVLATGGGAVLRDRNRQMMLERGWVVALTADEETIVARVGHDPNRPLLTGDVRSKVATLLEARKHAYDFADCKIDTSGKTPESLALEILMHYRG